VSCLPIGNGHGPSNRSGLVRETGMSHIIARRLKKKSLSTSHSSVLERTSTRVFCPKKNTQITGTKKFMYFITR